MKLVRYTGTSDVRFYWNGFCITIKPGVLQINNDVLADALVDKGYCSYYSGSDPIVGSEDPDQNGYASHSGTGSPGEPGWIPEWKFIVSV